MFSVVWKYSGNKTSLVWKRSSFSSDFRMGLTNVLYNEKIPTLQVLPVRFIQSLSFFRLVDDLTAKGITRFWIVSSVGYSHDFALLHWRVDVSSVIAEYTITPGRRPSHHVEHNCYFVPSANNSVGLDGKSRVRSVECGVWKMGSMINFPPISQRTLWGTLLWNHHGHSFHLNWTISESAWTCCDITWRFRNVYKLTWLRMTYANWAWVICAPILCQALLLAVIVRSVKTWRFGGNIWKS